MHKIKKFQFGGSSTNWLSNLFSTKNIVSGVEGLNKFTPTGMGSMPTGLPQTSSEAENMNAVLGNTLKSGLSSILDFSNINNSNMNSNSKSMAKTDAAFNGITGAAANIPGPVGLVAGGLNLVNKLGGALIGTPKVMKDYVANDRAMQSSAYAGIASSAGDAQNSIDAYKGSGLVGKLFGRSNIKNQVNEANRLQSKVSGILNTSDNIKSRAASSANFFGMKSLSDVNGGINWNQDVQFGRKGMKVKPIHIKKENEGKFTEYKERTGKSTSEALESKDPHVRKMAQFAKNAKKWKHQTGGTLLNGNLPRRNRQQIVQEGYDNTYGKNPTIVDPLDDILSAPQRGATKLVTGTYQNPSEALGLNNKWAAAGADLALDPLNALFFLKGRKLSKLAEIAGESKYHPGTAINLTHPRDASRVLKKARNLEMIDKIQNIESTYNNLVMNKKGGIIETVSDRLKRQALVIANMKPKLVQSLDKEQVTTFANGGIIENVIVDGKLHAHKHNLKELEEFKDADITHKGVAVVTKSEGGEITQHAEVEKDELILHLKLSKQLESWAEEGTDDHMIKAGKLLAKEILNNTRDSASGILEND